MPRETEIIAGIEGNESETSSQSYSARLWGQAGWVLNAITQQAQSTALPVYHYVTDWLFGDPITFEQNFIRRLKQAKDAVVDTREGYITFELKEVQGKTVLGIVDEEGAVQVLEEPWEQRLTQYLESIKAKIQYVEHGELSGTWSETDFTEFKDELVEEGLIRESAEELDLDDVEINKHLLFSGEDKDLKLDLYLKWVNRYGRPERSEKPENEDGEEEPKTLWDAFKTLSIAGLMVGSGLAGTRQMVTWVQKAATTGLVPHTGFDASSLALGVLGTAMTSNPLWMGLSMFSYGQNVYGQRVNGTIPNQTAGVGQQFNLTINMRELFGASAGGITITQANGNPLPGWLSVNIKPSLIGNFSIPGGANGVAISGTMAYVASETGGLQIIDVSHPTNPVLKGTYNSTSGQTNAVAISGTTVYVAKQGSWSGLQVIDVSNTTNPILKGNYSTTGYTTYASGIAISDTIAYVATTNGLQIIDFSNATHPVLKFSYAAGSYALGVAISDNMAYVTIYGVALQIVDVSNATNPILMGSYGTYGSAQGVAISNTMVYVTECCGWSGMLIIDVSNPTYPILEGSCSPPGWATRVAISGAMAYVTDATGSVQIVDISNATNSVLVGSYGTPGGVQETAISGTTVYVAEIGSWSGLQIIDVSSWRLTGIPKCGDVGKIDIKITALNGADTNVSDIFTIDVEGSPIVGALLSSQPGCCTVGIGQFYNFTFITESFAMVSGGTFAYNATTGDNAGLPNWLSFTPTTRTFAGTPTNASYLGPLELKLIANRCGGTASQTFTLNIVQTLSAANIAQTISYFENSDYSFNLLPIVIATPSPTVTVVLTLSDIAAGAFTVVGSGDSYNATTGVWQAGGNTYNINVLLAYLSFQPTTNSYKNFTIEVSIVDGYGQNLSSTIHAIGVKTESSANTAHGTSTGAIVGGVIGGVVVIGVCGTLVAVGIWRHRKHKKEQEILFSQAGEKIRPKSQEIALEERRASTSGVPRIKAKELKLGRALGQGGFGTVYKGLWSVGNTEVAVKKLNPGLEMLAEMIADFEKEAAIMAKLRHLNIVQIYGICRDETSYSIVMEFMGNGALDKLLYNRERELPWQPTRWQIAGDCACGLGYLHNQSIMHRDVKSANVLLDANMRAKWTDFGLSRDVGGATKTTMTKGMGTMLWMAPEILKGETHYTYKADVYSYGILLWEITAREIPYQEVTNQFQLLQSVVAGGRPVVPTVTPVRFAALMRRCWTQEAKDRPDMEEVKNELDQIIEQERSTPS